MLMASVLLSIVEDVEVFVVIEVITFKEPLISLPDFNKGGRGLG